MPDSWMASLYAADALLSNTCLVGVTPCCFMRFRARSRAAMISPLVLFFIGSTHMELLVLWYKIIWYRFPLLDVVGNFPVWSVNSVSLVSCTFIVTSSVLGGSGAPSVVCCSDALVDWTPCRCVLICPYCVSSDSGKCLLTFLTLINGQVLKFPALMALSQVVLVGKPAAPWRYRMACAMLGNSNTFPMVLASRCCDALM